MSANDYDFESSEMYNRNSYRVKRPKPTRRRVSKPAKSSSGVPGGIRQRRNKHWNW